MFEYIGEQIFFKSICFWNRIVILNRHFNNVENRFPYLKPERMFKKFKRIICSYLLFYYPTMMDFFFFYKSKLVVLSHNSYNTPGLVLFFYYVFFFFFYVYHIIFLRLRRPLNHTYTTHERVEFRDPPHHLAQKFVQYQNVYLYFTAFLAQFKRFNFQ